jgi:hypothetical protein
MCQREKTASTERGPMSRDGRGASRPGWPYDEGRFAGSHSQSGLTVVKLSQSEGGRGTEAAAGGWSNWESDAAHRGAELGPGGRA